MSSHQNCVHFDLDGAWPADAISPETHVDCRAWGPRLRYSTSRRTVESFYDFAREKSAAFTLFGSGDFHHLTALWLRRIEEPFTLVSFDNHPDWDIRPPRWCCGTWINRALDLPALKSAAIWGCGNFELNWPGYLYVNHRALREKRLAVFPWTERLKSSGRRRFPGLMPSNWREHFSNFASAQSGRQIYVTVDLDCIRENETTTNWEQGLFTVEDIVWAIETLSRFSKIIGGDLCGAYSEPRYAGWLQHLSAKLDHPRKIVNAETAAAANLKALRMIWRALTDGDQRDSRSDERHTAPEPHGNSLL